MSNRKVRILAGVAVAAILLALAIEAGLRIFPDLRPSSAQQRIEAIYRIDTNSEPWWVHDDELGFLERPDRDEEIRTIDYEYRRRTDQFGFVNAVPWPQQADIVFLGDSLLSGVGVGIDGQFTTLVSEQGPGLSVINLGLPGSSPQHLLRIYERFGARLRPKFVIACLYVASDVDNAKHFDVWQKAGRQWPYEEFRANHYLEALATLEGQHATPSMHPRNAGAGNDDEHVDLLRRLWKRIKSLAMIEELIYVLDPYRKAVIHDVSWADGSRVYLYRRFQNRLESGIGTDYPEISEVFFGPLEKLRRSVESDGARFVVALIPSKEEIFAHAGYTGNLRLVNEVREELSIRKMDVLDLYPAIRRLAESTSPYFAHDIHLNAAGNQALATAITSWLNDGRNTPSANGEVPP